MTDDATNLGMDPQLFKVLTAMNEARATQEAERTMHQNLLMEAMNEMRARFYPGTATKAPESPVEAVPVAEAIQEPSPTEAAVQPPVKAVGRPKKAK